MKEWPTYTCPYRYDGKNYTVHVQAESEEDAVKRLRAIGMTAQVDGELVDEGYLFPMGLTAIITVGILNTWNRFVKYFTRGA